MNATKRARLAAFAAVVFALSACSGSNQTLPNSANPSSAGNAARRANGTTIQRPISDWLNAQGTLPGALDYSVFGAYRSSLPNCDGTPLGFVDYAGLTNAFLIRNHLPSLGTTMTGSVHQSDNGDGTSTVSVELDTTNAFSFATCGTASGGFVGPYLGYTPRQVLSGAPAALGSSHMSLVFTIPGTGSNAPLTDLVTIPAICPAPAPCLQSIKFTASASGPVHAIYGVPEGTPGTMSIEQIGTFHSFGRAGIDGFTAEFIKVQPAY